MEGCKGHKIWSRFVLCRFFRMLYNIRKTAKALKPDFAIGVMIDYTIFTIIALTGLRIPVIGSHHNSVKNIPSLYKWCYGLVCPFASAMTVLTHYDYKNWRKRFSNVVCMPNPIPTAKNRETVEKQNYVLAVGRVDDPQKGFDNLMDIWNQLYEKNPQWKLLIAGKYSQDVYNSLIARLDSVDNARVEFLGFRKDVNDIMKHSSIFVLSSRFEGLPMGLMEAMDAGCCCVAFNVETGPSEIIRNNYSGVLVESQNKEKMVEALQKVMSDDSFRMRLMTNAPISVRKFDTEKILERWEILFRIINKKKNT